MEDKNINEYTPESEDERIPEEESIAAKKLRIMGDKAIPSAPETAISKAEAEAKKHPEKKQPEIRKTQAEGIIGEGAEESGKAKVVRVLSADDLGVNEIKGDKKENWFANFWYHHKWKTIIIAFFAIVIGICVIQSVTKEVPDVSIIYVGPGYVNGTDNEAIGDAFKSVMRDYNGDGKVGIRFSTIIYLNEKQIEAKRLQAQLRGETFTYDAYGNAKNYEQFQYEMMVGDSVIYLLDPAIYESVKGEKVFAKLADILDEAPAGAIDEFGIPLSELKAYKYFTVLGTLPADTVLCVRRVSAMDHFKGEDRANEVTKHHTEMIADLFRFEYPEGYTGKE